MGGGVLPACIKNNRLYFLFGKENKFADTPGWSDFGGGQDGKETFLDAAIREGQEEMTGILGDMKPYLDDGYYIIDFEKYKYRTHIVWVNYDEALVTYFNNVASFLQNKLDSSVIKKSKLFEKCELKWFSVEEMMAKKHLFRKYYQEIVDQINKERFKIKSFLKKKNKKKNYNNNNNTRKEKKQKQKL